MEVLDLEVECRVKAWEARRRELEEELEHYRNIEKEKDLMTMPVAFY